MAVADQTPEDRGLMVAVIQLAITLSATMGGLMFDASGPVTNVLGSATILMLAALVALLGGRALPHGA